MESGSSASSIRAAHIVPSVLEKASGPSYTVPALCRALARSGCAVTAYMLDGVPDGFPAGVEARAFPRWPVPWRLGVSPAMRHALHADAAGLDIVHNHSLWMMPNVYAAEAATAGARLVVSPRGTMSDWAWRRSAWRKQLIGWCEIGRAHV